MTSLAKLKNMTDQDIRTWLRRVEKKGVSKLVYAMLGAENETRERVFVNMSVHARDVLKADIKKHEKMHVTDAIIQKSARIIENLF